MPRRLRVLELGSRGGRRTAPRARSHPPCRGEGVSRWSETLRGGESPRPPAPARQGQLAAERSEVSGESAPAVKDGGGRCGGNMGRRQRRAWGPRPSQAPAPQHRQHAQGQTREATLKALANVKIESAARAKAEEVLTATKTEATREAGASARRPRRPSGRARRGPRSWMMMRTFKTTPPLGRTKPPTPKSSSPAPRRTPRRATPSRTVSVC